MQNKLKEDQYDLTIIKMFTVMSIFWAIAGMVVGVFIAAELAFPALNMEVPYLSFGRLKPLHTNLVVFAFGGNTLMATSYYIVQKTSHVRLFNDFISKWTFWGWNLIMILATVTLPLGITTGKEYAEFEWPIDILMAIVWISYGINYFGTIAKRKIKHIYVANWFYMSMIITVTILHVVNSLSIPVSLTKSYSMFSGVQDAMIQWWYGHNAVGFFLTSGFVGMMYYCIPKQSGKPVYSYRLSIIHFWAIVFLYIWAGPHHLHYTALPDWTQTLGMTFSLMLLLPSWGGMINGIMSLSGAWEKLKYDPVIRFMIMALVFYGLSTFEGPLMAIKSVNSLSHYTDWTIGHVHSGALGWVSLISFGSLYLLIKELWNKEIYSVNLIFLHFWLAIFGILLYIVAMWISGITQGLMWRKFDEFGNLTYSFIDSVEKVHPYYIIRLAGGGIYLSGVIIMAYNFFMTVRRPQAVTKQI